MRLSSMEYYGLNKTFKDAGFFEATYHGELIQEIRSAILNGSLIAVSGIVGSGKTALLRHLQNVLNQEGQVIVSKSLMVEKEKVNLTALITALYYDLATKKEVKIPFHGERRERELQELIRSRKKPVVLFVDEAHDLHSNTILGLKRLIEMIQDSGNTLSVLLAGHPRLKNRMQKPTMEEIGYRTNVFCLDAAEFDRREYIDWLLTVCSREDTSPDQILEPAAGDLLAEKLKTPLQIIQHLTSALEAGHDSDERPVSYEIAEASISHSLADWEVSLTRHGYNTKNLATLLDTKQAEVRSLFKGDLEPARTQELRDKLLVVGLPVK